MSDPTKRCEHCGVMVRKDAAGSWWHVVEVPGSSRTSSTYRYCRLTVASPAESGAEVLA